MTLQHSHSSIELCPSYQRLRHSKKGLTLTGVKKLSATKRALAFSLSKCQHRISISSREDETNRETYEKLHLRYLFIHLFHKLYDEVYQLMLQHILGVEICDQKRDIITLNTVNYKRP